MDDLPEVIGIHGVRTIAFLNAVKKGDAASIALHLANGTDLIKSARTGTDGEYAIHIAARGGHDNIVRFLIKNGADVMAGDNDGANPLHYVKSEGAATAIADAGADVNGKDKGGSTPLHRVLNENVARLLINRGADVNAKDADGRTPLHDVGDETIAKLLIEAGASVNARDGGGNTPLHFAKSVGIARALIENSAEIDATTKDGKTPLHDVVNDAVARLLIDRGADVNSRTRFGKTPLHEASNAAIVHVLGEKGADINAKDSIGCTPLHRGVLAERLGTVVALIQRGARLDVQDNDGKTAMELIQKRFNKPEEKKQIIDAIESAIKTSKRGARSDVRLGHRGPSEKSRKSFERGKWLGI